MDKSKFEKYIVAAKSLDSDYYIGYRDGLSRHYHGVRFSTNLSHSEYMSLGVDGGHRQERGDGYRHGFAGAPPRGIHGNLGNSNAQGELPADTTLQIRLNTKYKDTWKKRADDLGVSVSKHVIDVMNADCEKQKGN